MASLQPSQNIGQPRAHLPYRASVRKGQGAGREVSLKELGNFHGHGGDRTSSLLVACGRRIPSNTSITKRTDRSATTEDKKRVCLLSIKDEGPGRRRVDFHEAQVPRATSGKVSTEATGLPKEDGLRCGDNLTTGAKFTTRKMEGGTRPKKARAGNFNAALPSEDECLVKEEHILSKLAWKKMYRTGPGLRNMGNTCFINATLQCMSYLPPLSQHVLEGPGDSAPGSLLSLSNIKGRRETGIDVMAMMEQTIKQIHLQTQRRESWFAPVDFVRNLTAIGKEFHRSRQEDAHEFLRKVLEGMVLGCLRQHGIQKSAPARLTETTAVHRIFGGYIRSRLKCTRCGHCSDTYDPVMDISLDIFKGAKKSVESCLDHFTKKEILDGDNRWRCAECHQLVRAEKDLTISKAPNVLALHLKRFGFHSTAFKIKTKVAFDEELELKVTGSESRVGYNLTGVVVHQGRDISSGHYFAYVRSSSGVWMKMDDDQVSKVKTETVLAAEAYMLFYTRRHAPKQSTPTCRSAGGVKIPPSVSLDTGVERRGAAGTSPLTHAEQSVRRCAGDVSAGSANQRAGEGKSRSDIGHQPLRGENPPGRGRPPSANIKTAKVTGKRAFEAWSTPKHEQRFVGASGSSLWEDISPAQGRAGVLKRGNETGRRNGSGAKAERRREWDRLLDMGKTKKVKRKSPSSPWDDQSFEKKQRGFHSQHRKRHHGKHPRFR